MLKRYHVLEEAVLDDKGGGGDPPPADPPKSDPPPADPLAGKSAFALAADGGDPPATPPASSAARPDWCPEDNWDAETGEPLVPEKYFDKEGKKPNLSALARGYKELHKRFGAAANLPPKDPSGYTFEKRDGEELAFDDDALKSFWEFAHEKSLTNEQANAFIREHMQGLEQARAGFYTANEARTLQTLEKEHGGKPGAAAVLRDAMTTFKKFATPDELKGLDTLVTDPRTVNVLARIAKELRTDDPPGGHGGASGFEAQTTEATGLLADMSGPYWNANKPGHAAAVAKVTAWQEACAQRGVSALDLQRKARG